MSWVKDAMILVLAYIIGAIPFGAIIVRLKTGKDIRQIESGRTGGTNVMRAAGFWAGFFTAILDLLKGASAVWLGRVLAPGNVWMEVLSPVAAVIGHNYSIFLIERNEKGMVRFRGGAGGAPTAGAAFALWPGSIWIIVPVGLVLLFGVGFASIATMSIPLVASLIFAYRAWLGVSPWEYIFFGVFTEILLIYALRPNIIRLLQGNERLVGLRAWLKKRMSSRNNPSAHHQTMG